MLVARFGPLPSGVEAALAGASTGRLDRWTERAATAATLEAVGIGVEEAPA